MKQITIEDIRSYGPCYDPNRYLSEDFKGTILDIIDNKQIPFPDRLWVVLRTDLVSEKLMRVFAVWCARQVQHLMTDERSTTALDVMDAYNENYFLIEDEDYQAAWNEERAAAGAAARDAARDAAGAAAGAAAWAAAGAAAWAAAGAAAGAAARAAAGAATWDATWAAAWAAAWDATWAAAWDATWDAARDAARDAQETKLREMVIAGVKTGDTK